LDKHLHIVCLDVPWPVDYGGVFEIFCKIKALHTEGIHIHLHCFRCKRDESQELNQYCTEVFYYQRQEGHKGFSHKLPYIVASRAHPDLTERLLKDDYPILLEGIHCTFLLQNEQFANRKVILRLHNVEHIYYHELFRTSTSWWKKIYYLHESRLLKKYEASVAGKTTILTLSEEDANTYRRDFNARDIAYLPVFLPYDEIHCKEGIGCYCLYHGNLSIPENEAAVIWLLKHVFHELQVPFLIAGKNPSVRLQKEAAKHPHACLVPNPSDQEMQDMIGCAQINILPSFNNTGIKFKLLNALFNGRHCIVNPRGVKGTGLEPACHVGTTPDAFQQIIAQLYHQPFAPEEIRLRQRLLEGIFDNSKNAARLIQSIW
jgi:Glycosyl transferases group 1